MKYLWLTLSLGMLTMGTADDKKDRKMTFIAVEHASFVLKTDDLVIFVDPVGVDRYTKHGRPDLILITHAHGDHLAPDLIKSAKTADTVVIGPKIVTDKLGYGVTMKNGETKTVKDVKIEAIGAYNLTKDRRKFHPKGVGNGYILTLAGKRVYIAGDTEDIPEMRALKNIDHAFVCMNLPYTMTVEQAADAVLEFKPGIVYPYHYRGRPKMSDIEKFKQLVAAKDSNIEVRFLDWYGQSTDSRNKRERE